MEYNVGQVGRIIAARLFEGEDIYNSIEQIARQENIKAAAVTVVGGLRKAKVVVGPKCEEPKIEPNFREFEGPGEIVGVGTVYEDDQGPVLHLHASAGRGDNIITGCPRGGATTFLVLEVTIIEIVGVTGKREPDEKTGFNLLRFSNE